MLRTIHSPSGPGSVRAQPSPPASGRGPLADDVDPRRPDCLRRGTPTTVTGHSAPIAARAQATTTSGAMTQDTAISGTMDDVPRYEFRCRECTSTFEVSRPMSAAADPATCPD